MGESSEVSGVDQAVKDLMFNRLDDLGIFVLVTDHEVTRPLAFINCADMETAEWFRRKVFALGGCNGARATIFDEREQIAAARKHSAEADRIIAVLFG